MILHFVVNKYFIDDNEKLTHEYEFFNFKFCTSREVKFCPNQFVIGISQNPSTVIIGTTAYEFIMTNFTPH